MTMVVGKYEGIRPCPMAATTDQQEQAMNAEVYQKLQGTLPTKRTFETGATRDTDEGKLDFEGFLSPAVLERFAQYMHQHRHMSDGSVRDSDNWQKGIPVQAYMKSLWRHFFAVWKAYRAAEALPEEELCALMFNVQGLLHETLKAR